GVEILLETQTPSEGGLAVIGVAEEATRGSRYLKGATALYEAGASASERMTSDGTETTLSAMKATGHLFEAAENIAASALTQAELTKSAGAGLLKGAGKLAPLAQAAQGAERIGDSLAVARDVSGREGRLVQELNSRKTRELEQITTSVHRQRVLRERIEALTR